MRWVCHTHNKGYESVTDTLMIRHTYGVLSIQCAKHTPFLQCIPSSNGEEPQRE